MKIAASTFCLLSLFPFVALAGCNLSASELDDEHLKLKKTVKEIGLNKIIVRSVPPAVPDSESQSKRYGLTRDELRILNNTLPTLSQSIQFRSAPSVVRHKEVEKTLNIVGCTGDFLEDNRLQVLRGRFVVPSDIESRHNVCVLSESFAKEMSPASNPLGKVVPALCQSFFQNRWRG